MKHIKVSIIVPIFNAELYLNKCLDSIVKQTYKDIEIILVNDGSTDNSGEICDKYASKDKRIIVFHKENGGVSSARNIGLNVSTGDYIMFIDSDDWVESNMVNTLVKIQEVSNYDVIMFGSYIENTKHDKTKRVKFKKESFNSKNEIMKFLPSFIKDEKITTLWNKIYKSSVIKKNNVKFNEELSIAEDALFNYKVFTEINSFHITEECLYHYMIRDVESLTKKYNPQKYEMLTYVNDYLLYAIEQKLLDSNILLSAQYIRVKNIYSCLLDLFNENYSFKLMIKLKYIKGILRKEDIKHFPDLGSKKFEILSWVLSTKNIIFIYFVVFIISKIRNQK